MTNAERRLRKLESCGSQGEIVIEIQYVREPPKCLADGRKERSMLGHHGPRVTTVYLSEDDLNL
jgi:hypothetical protein